MKGLRRMSRRSSAAFSPASRLPRHRRIARLCGSAASLAIAIVVLGLAALMARLVQGPVTLEPLVDRLEAAFEADVAALGYGLRIGGAQLRLGDGRVPTPGFYAEDVTLLDRDGAVLATVPHIRLAFRPFDLIMGQVSITRISLDRARLRLVQDLGRGVVADLGPPTEGRHTSAPDLHTLVAGILDSPPAFLRHLQVVEFIDATFQLNRGEDVLAIDPIDVSLTREATQINLNAEARTPDGGGLTANAALHPDGRLDATIGMQAVALADLSTAHPMLADLHGMAQRVTGEVAIAVDAAGRLAETRLTAALTPGSVLLTAPLGTVQVDVVEVAARLDGAPTVDGSAHIELERLAIRGPLGAVEASGSVAVALDNGAFVSATAVLALGPTTLPLALPREGATPPRARFDGGSLTARLDVQSGTLDLAELFLRRAAMTASLSGRVAAPTGADATASLSGVVEAMTLDDLMALWPPAAAPGARRWVEERMTTGRIPEATFSLAGPLAAPALALDFSFAQATARPLSPMPPLTGRGWGRITGETFELTLAEGVVEVPGPTGGRLTLDGSSFLLDDINDKAKPARITLRGAGPLPAVLSLIDTEPLELLARMPLDPGTVEGDATLTAALSLPLLRDLRLEQVGVEATANLRDGSLALDALHPGLTVEAQALSLAANTSRLSLEGTVRLAGNRLSLDWQESFNPAAGLPRSVLRLTGPIDLASIGIGELPAGIAVDRALPVALTLTRSTEPGAGFDLSADLAGAALGSRGWGWSKPAGAPGRLTARGRLTSAGTVLDALAVETADLSLAATARLDAAGSLRQAEIGSLTMGGQTDIKASITRGREGVTADLQGKFLDLAPLIDAHRTEGGDSTAAHGPPLSIRLDLDRIGLGDGRTLHGATGWIDRDETGALALDLEGQLGGRVPATLSVALDAAGDGSIRLASADAGGLLREAGLARRAVGGRMEAEATLSTAPNGGTLVDGTAEIADLVVVEDGALDRLLAEADLNAALAKLRREGIKFDRVRLPFRWHAGRLHLHEALAHGPVVGITLSGNYHPASDRLDMEGVFTPLYGVSGLLGHVPLIGPLLTGGEGQGLIAFTFDLEGSMGDPDVTINPLSALLPGVLRQLIQPRATPG